MDHQGMRARLESARLIRRFVEASGPRLLIILGDFNCDPASEPYRALTEGKAKPGPLADAFSTVNDSGGTYHAFTGVPQGGRIDWILFDHRLECLTASVDRRSKAGRYPSDHFPVAATLRLKPPSRMTP
jgi:endonuclease/exonuclease/phosphatase family metal-dependent hydrolase